MTLDDFRLIDDLIMCRIRQSWTVDSIENKNMTDKVNEIIDKIAEMNKDNV